MQTASERAPPPAGELAPSDTGLAAGTRIGVWEIGALIGRGGMGEVYRARRSDGLYDQTVALKLIHGASAARSARFDRERRRLARMEHPGIARIVDGGEAPDGRAFLAMEYVDGAPMHEHTRGAGLDRRAILHLFVQLCRAVSHAHNRLILHRDIKAENVLVDRDGQVRLIDFGIASDLESDDSEGMALTLASAAPEQLRGEPVTVQTDIFALGVLLHHLLADRLPERRADGGMMVRREDIGSADLVAILQRTVATSPEARYFSVETLHDDILAVLDGRPVGAREGGLAYRAATVLRRFPLATGLAAAFVLALAGGLGFSLKFASEASAEAARAKAALEEAVYQSDYANANLLGQNTFGSILYELFAEEGRADALTSILLERWRGLHEIRDQSPDLAASVSFVVGRNFFLRRDHISAQEVLGTWLEGGYGPEALRNTGREFYAMSLFESGRQADALPIMRQVMESYETGHKRPVPTRLTHLATCLFRQNRRRAPVRRCPHRRTTRS